MSYKDSYIIEGDLGSGEFGQVKYAQSKKDKNLNVCVKILKKTLSYGQREITLNQEKELDLCKQMKNINNQNLVQIYDVYDSDVNDENNYIFMERCDLNLDELMNNTKNEQSKQNQNFSKEQLFDIITQIAKGYNQLISQNIIHRDLKPQNILCNIRNNELIVKIADFGLSKYAQTNKIMTKKVGTPYYQAPEVIYSQSYDNRCDIFSLGVIIFELALLQRQFKKKEIESLKQKTFSQLHSDVLKQNLVDQDIIKLLDKMIVYDSNQRITWESLLNYDINSQEIQLYQSPNHYINQPQLIQSQQQQELQNNQSQKQEILQNNFQQFSQNQANSSSDKKQIKKQNSLQLDFQQIQQGQQPFQRLSTMASGQTQQSQFTPQAAQQAQQLNYQQQRLQQQEQYVLQIKQGQTGFHKQQPTYPGNQGQLGLPGQLTYSGISVQPGFTGQQGQPSFTGQQGQPSYPGQQGQPSFTGQQGQPVLQIQTGILGQRGLQDQQIRNQFQQKIPNQNQNFQIQFQSQNQQNLYQRGDKQFQCKPLNQNVL
ncbi:unnamed protein product [Paramecium pentaurelia]|uniref:Protein kinase domain-containing protein n=1 Tax=Paramecium pentaurelia TaxID=43138 RepID=A0A8S1SDD9_9CILI|nr:unnamed protein product [Paramecium pentaurelia]